MKFYASIPKIIFANFSRDSFRFFVPEKPRRIVTQIHVHFFLWKVKTQFLRNLQFNLHKDRLETNVPLQMTFVRPFLAIFRHMYVQLSQN